MKKVLKSLMIVFCMLCIPLAVIAAPVIPENYMFTFGSGDIVYKDGDLSGYVSISKYTGPTFSYDTPMKLSFAFDGNMNTNNWDSGNIIIEDASNNIILKAAAQNVSLKRNPVTVSVPSITYTFTFTPGTVDTTFFSSDLIIPNITYGGTQLDIFFIAYGDISNSNDWQADITGGSLAGNNPVVPVPAAAWIFLTGIAGLAGLRRKNKK